MNSKKGTIIELIDTHVQERLQAGLKGRPIFIMADCPSCGKPTLKSVAGKPFRP